MTYIKGFLFFLLVVIGLALALPFFAVVGLACQFAFVLVIPAFFTAVLLSPGLREWLQREPSS